MAAATLWAAPCVAQQDDHTASGAQWAARMPANWNGTLLIYSHGYSATLRVPDLAPPGTQSWLLEHGYALIASGYSASGWAVSEAVSDQIAALDAFVEHYGPPHRIIAWGSSMGGLITIALAEQFPDRIAAALPSCASIAGTLGMMNEALDGAFAFRVLLAADTDVQLVNIDDDQANSSRAEAAITRALRTRAGRARLSLAAALSQMPPPTSNDIDSVETWARAFTAGVFLPRSDQERRAGGVFSWNTGVDYRRQLTRSGQAARVRAAYRGSGANLRADLRALNSAPRIAADSIAVAYMRLHYAPSGELRIPVFSYHTLGDPLTVASQQMSYASAVFRAGATRNLKLGWVQSVTHCDFTASEHIAALNLMESRLRDGRWNNSPEQLNSQAAKIGLGEGRFTVIHPDSFLRPCGQSPCPGERGTPAQ